MGVCMGRGGGVAIDQIITPGQRIFKLRNEFLVYGRKKLRFRS